MNKAMKPTLGQLLEAYDDMSTLSEKLAPGSIQKVAAEATLKKMNETLDNMLDELVANVVAVNPRLFEEDTGEQL
jgi:hypothetical protein